MSGEALNGEASSWEAFKGAFSGKAPADGTVWAGKKTAKEALDSAVKRGNVELRRFERANSK